MPSAPGSKPTAGPSNPIGNMSDTNKDRDRQTTNAVACRVHFPIGMQLIDNAVAFQFSCWRREVLRAVSESFVI